MGGPKVGLHSSHKTYHRSITGKTMSLNLNKPLEKPEILQLKAIRDKSKFISWLASNPDNFMQDL